MCAQVSPLQAILGPIYRRNKYSGHGHGGEVNLVFFERWSWSWGEVNLPVHTVSEEEEKEEEEGHTNVQYIIPASIVLSILNFLF